MNEKMMMRRTMLTVDHSDWCWLVLVHWQR